MRRLRVIGYTSPSPTAPSGLGSAPTRSLGGTLKVWGGRDLTDPTHMSNPRTLDGRWMSVLI
ncbi:hypothetical protein [Nocardia asiatica]|uniref:hypothetical protein n=1 Tax=Nocardia asiatica TaxID=209252 RepID=UPI003EDF9E39